MRPWPEKPTARPRVVLDTNVLISALLSKSFGRKNSPSLIVVDQLQRSSPESPQVLISGPILREYEDVLSRPRLGIPSELAVSAIQRISTIAEFVTQKSRLELLDSDDAMFLECALDGRADYLITGNKRHYPNWTIVVSPREFLERPAG